MSEKLPPKKKHLAPEEIKDLIAESGTELSDEELSQISGGWGNSNHCPPGQHDYQYKRLEPSPTSSGVFKLYVCTKCGDGILE
jgi:bacteriocin-like protein